MTSATVLPWTFWFFIWVAIFTRRTGFVRVIGAVVSKLREYIYIDCQHYFLSLAHVRYARFSCHTEVKIANTRCAEY